MINCITPLLFFKCSFFFGCRVKLRCARLSETTITMTHTLIARIPSRRRPNVERHDIPRDRWTQLTLMVNIMTHTHLLKTMCKCLRQLCIVYLTETLSLHRLARSRSHFIAKMNNADMDQAILPQEYQTGSDSKRENLCQQDSERITKTTPRASNSWVTGSGWSIKLWATGWYRRSFKCTEN